MGNYELLPTMIYISTNQQDAPHIRTVPYPKPTFAKEAFWRPTRTGLQMVETVVNVDAF